MYDYIIVGAGTAGCILANKLSANPANRILLLESGYPDDSPLIRIPGEAGKIMRSKLIRVHQTIAQRALNGRHCPIPQANVVGGGSSVNGMIYIRGNPEDYRRWHALGNEGWDWPDALAYFIAEENNAVHGAPYHGKSGAVHVRDIPSPNPLTRIFVRAAAECGIAPNPDFNGSHQDGAGIFQVTNFGGYRWSAANAYLRPAESRRNLEIITQAQVLGIIVKDRRAEAVEVQLADGTRRSFHAKREIILSAGAVSSPSLLLRSGIGPGDELRAIGIDVVHDLPGVGKNFHDHLHVSVAGRCSRPLSYDGMDKWWPSFRHKLEMAVTGRGPATSTWCEASAYMRTRPSKPQPDLAVHFLPVYAMSNMDDWPKGHGVTLNATFLQPKSRGEIRLASPDPADAPLIDPNYLGASEDMPMMLEAAKLARRILQAEAFRPYCSEEFSPGSGVRSDADLERFVRAHAVTDFHPVGSCKMGKDAMAVVDDRLRVHGLEGLRVIDASIMPVVVSGNTNAPTMMIAAKGADMILSGENRRGLVEKAPALG